MPVSASTIAAPGFSERGLHAVFSRRWSAGGQALLLVVATSVYLWFYADNPNRPRSAAIPGWTVWFDQSLYYKSAIAWAHGNLDPTQHWYLPGYTLAGAPFAAVMPLHVFLIPDLLALLAAMWLFGRLTAKLAPELPAPAFMGGLVFFITSIALPTLRDVWVVPNSTSLSTPLIYACLLSAVMFCTDDGRPRFVFLAALASCAVAGIRPSDATGTTIAAACGIVVSLIIHRGGPRRAALAVVCGVAGALVIALTLGLAYYALYGTAKSNYVILAMMLGFEWRLLPLRWVELVLDPRPVLANGRGLIEGFPWIVPGIAGCAAALLVPQTLKRRMADCIVIIAAVLHVIVYLCFRDLHPIGLFQFSNFHYFKWVLPVMALYAVRFTWTLAVGPGRLSTVLAGLALLSILLPWHISIDAVSPAAPFGPKFGADNLSFNADLNDVQNVVMVQSNTDPGLLFAGGHSLQIDGHEWGFVDFRAYPEPGGFMLTPLRQLGSGPAVLKLEPGKGVLATSHLPVLARQNIVFGLPCLVYRDRPTCRPTELLQPPALADSGILTFDGDDVTSLPVGWSYVELSSRFTDGKLATIRFRVPQSLIGKALNLELVTGAYQPVKAAQLRARMQVNGVEVAQWKFPNADRITVSASVPAGVIGSDGIASLVLHIDNPRTRHVYDENSNDTRQLGLLVKQLRLSPAP